jgi:hypothetical protein
VDAAVKGGLQVKKREKAAYGYDENKEGNRKGDQKTVTIKELHVEKRHFENEILVGKVLSFEPKQAAVANLLARATSVCEQT